MARLYLAVMMCIAVSEAMIFHPLNPSVHMWDTWLFVQPGHPTTPFYLNYLSGCDASCGGPVGGAWNGVSAALSADGVHFADEGQVIEKDEKAGWLGSGSVLMTANGTYVMNFSEEYDCEGGNCQSIFFATTDDLVAGWTRLPFAPPPANDTNVFKYGPGYTVGGRWDCIATVPKPGSPGEYYGYWTASPAGHGGAGVGETTDLTGHHWKSLSPITAGMPSAEVGSTVVIDGKYFMLYHGGHLYTSTDPITGYVADPVNADFHTDGNGVAFSRFWNVQGQDSNQTILLTHQWVVKGKIYLAPIKECRLGNDGHLRAGYWPGNDGLKGRAIPLGATPAAGPAEPVAAERCAPGAAGQKWTIVGSKVQSGVNRSMCLGFDLSLGALVPCNGVNAADVTLETNGSLVSGGLCLALAGARVKLAGCSSAAAAVKWTTCGSASTIELVTSDPLKPVALYRFEDAANLGTNDATQAKELGCSGQGCSQAVDKAGGPRAHSLRLDGGSFLSFNKDAGVPKGVPLNDAAYTVSGWVKLSADSVVTSRSPHAATNMHGMVGWGDFATPFGSNAMAVNLPGSFYNYWFSNGAASSSADMLFEAPGVTEGWNHVLCRSDSAKTKALRDCYWNGALEGQQANPPTHKVFPSHFRIGSTHDGELFDGEIDDVAIFDRALGDDEIVQALVGDFEAADASTGVCLGAALPTPTPEPAKTFVVASLDLNLAVGAVVEATMSCAPPNTTGGFVVGAAGSATGAGTAFLWDCGSQQFMIGANTAGSFKPTAVYDRKPGFPATADVLLRLLVRTAVSGDGMVEFYVNDLMSHPYTISAPPQKLGSLGLLGPVDATSAKAWRMTLAVG